MDIYLLSLLGFSHPRLPVDLFMTVTCLGPIQPSVLPVISPTDILQHIRDILNCQFAMLK